MQGRNERQNQPTQILIGRANLQRNAFYTKETANEYVLKVNSLETQSLLIWKH